MTYRIVKTDAFKVFGIEGIISTSGDPNYYPHEGEFWGVVNSNPAEDSQYTKLANDAGIVKHPFNDNMFNQEMCKIHGLMNYNQINETTYGYMLCSFVAPDSNTNGYKIVDIPAATWVAFNADMPDWDMCKTMGELILYSKEWIASSGFEKADGPEFEMYGGSPDHGYIEYWMPITKA